ncbi:unnamed protein product [Thelazia callipaeda]|uniref:EF-hand domain-containing protein n=1 Tax=Thelazia callipaeda TaxID=103827 RepID=A0A0N5CPN7_THECL|nr:unnamed protein product [Thelazia callipaeda]
MPKKDIVEHSIRLSIRNELPRSEITSDTSQQKHKSNAIISGLDRTQSGVLRSNELKAIINPSVISRQITSRSLTMDNKKIIEDKTQQSLKSLGSTQVTTESGRSKTLTESTLENILSSRKTPKIQSKQLSKTCQEPPVLNTLHEEVSSSLTSQKLCSESDESGSSDESYDTTDESKRTATLTSSSTNSKKSYERESATDSSKSSRINHLRRR